MSDKTFQDLLEIDLSPVATSPYRLTSSDIPDQKSRLLSEVLRGTTIDNKWKTPAIDLLTSIRERKPTVAEDIVWATGSSVPKVLSDMVASGAVKLGTDPLGFALGAKSAAVGVSVGAMAGRSVAGLLGAGAGGLGAGLALPAIASEALSIKPAGDEEDEMGVPYYVNSIRRLDVKYANEEITDTEYNEQKSKLLEGLKKYKEEKNEIVSSIQGREYPNKDIVESLISWGGRTLKENEDWREWQKEQRGMSPDATADTIGSFLGYIAPLWAGSYIYGSGLRKPGYKTLYKGSRFRETVVQTPSPYTRQQIIDKLERFGKGYSFTTMSGDYISRDVLKYIDETGDVDLVNYKPSDIQSAMAGAYGAIGTITEYGLGGVEPLVVGSFKKVGLKLPTAKAVGKAFVQESGEEAFQELEDFLAQKIDNTNTRTWGEALKDMAVSAAWGGAFGASIGGYAFHTNRKNLIKGIMKFGNGKINQAQATMVADAMIESVENTMNYKNDALWNNLREKIAYMYEGSDVSADNIDSMTNLEYTLIMQDSEWNGIKMEDNPIFKGEMTPFGWFREGIPEARRTEIQGYIKELTDLQDQLKKLNEAKEKDWEKIDEIESKINKFNTYVLEKLSDLARADARQVAKILRDTEQKFVQREKERATKKAIKGGSVDVIADELSKAGFKTRDMSGTQIKELARLNWELLQGKDLDKAQSRGTIQKKLADIEANVESGNRVLERAGYTPEQIAKMDDETWNRAVLAQYRSDLEGIEFQGEVFKVADENARLDDIYPAYDGETIEVDGKERIKTPIESTQDIKNVDAFVVFSDGVALSYTLKQNRVSGGAPSTYRGAYIPEYRFILKANKMDASTLSHELAHDWFETNFARYRSGQATPDFMRAWGALEQALGIQEGNKASIRKASEAFARAYEGWIMNKSDWARLINVDDKDKDAIVKLMEDYQNNLRDIYQDLTNPYFKDTWGKLGELKPELVQWFDKATNITNLDTLVERGEMTEAEANQEKLNRAIDKVITDTADEETAETLKEVRTLNDTARYEVEGGNKNSLQERLSALAREIDENNMLAKGNNYDTRRDMMQVAEAADNFVKTRLNDALAIINGEMAEVEGLYKEDIYTALERLAVENGDLGLLDELKNSEIANRLAKELGQRVAGFRNWKQSTDLDVVSALKSLDNRFNKALENKKAQKEFNSALDLLDESLSQQDKIADKELEATLKELECQ